MQKGRSTQKQTWFLSPFTPAYWRASAQEMKKLNKLVAVAMLVALQIALSTIFIMLGPSLRVYFTFLVSAPLAAIGGPIVSIPAAIVCDVVGVFTKGEAYFPGYTLSAILTFFVYAIVLYRRPINFWRVFAARAVVNIFINTLLGSVWRVVLYGEASYYIYVSSAIVKNLILLPIEVAALTLLFGALMKPMTHMKLIGSPSNIAFSKVHTIVSIIASIVISVVLIIFVLLK